ncbi:hypothetical protein R7D64_15695 [Vibrio sp. Vb2535]|uniref:hypothetical protein n=1 Tax=Vibrio TaxID=662 RepID=UPI00197F6A16|nr:MULTISPECIES: hypothetical protein [Vibrio]MBE3680812.1 hypothetical protein [Vibrio parahaemolyticus]MDN4733937.1 hypothetical protein [Vibrio parahaemolyticus]MDW1754364.1 hypothetical protein [Vibrio sp. Vb2535]QSI80500.1 hypothetical protein JYG29_14165 [Vibrio alginolyticus]URR27960.1 hypothetical protein NAL94_20455 [Vibrio alginolyticus]
MAAIDIKTRLSLARYISLKSALDLIGLSIIDIDGFLVENKLSVFLNVNQQIEGSCFINTAQDPYEAFMLENNADNSNCELIELSDGSEGIYDYSAIISGYWQVCDSSISSIRSLLNLYKNFHPTLTCPNEGEIVAKAFVKPYGATYSNNSNVFHTTSLSYDFFDVFPDSDYEQNDEVEIEVQDIGFEIPYSFDQIFLSTSELRTLLGLSIKPQKRTKTSERSLLRSIGAFSLLLSKTRASYRNGTKPNASNITDALNQLLATEKLNPLPGDIRKDISRGLAILLEED